MAEGNWEFVLLGFWLGMSSTAYLFFFTRWLGCAKKRYDEDERVRGCLGALDLLLMFIGFLGVIALAVFSRHFALKFSLVMDALLVGIVSGWVLPWWLQRMHPK